MVNSVPYGAVCNRRAAIGIVGGSAAASLLGLSVLTRSHADGDNPAVMRYGYGTGPSQFGELSLPGGSAVAPVVAIVHGGFWRTGFGVELGRPLAADLVNRGFAAVNVAYRRVGAGDAGGGGWPQTGQDVAAAVDALATEGQRLAGGRLNLSRVVGLGHSAGGQFVSRYEMANRVHETLGVRVTYVVANPSSYAWPDASRPLASASAKAALPTAGSIMSALVTVPRSTSLSAG